jgi:hypothetical protein
MQHYLCDGDPGSCHVSVMAGPRLLRALCHHTFDEFRIHQVKVLERGFRLPSDSPKHTPRTLVVKHCWWLIKHPLTLLEKTMKPKALSLVCMFYLVPHSDD